MFYAALDVSLRSVAVCIIDDEGKVRFERSVPSDVPDLVRCLNAFGEPIHQVGLEAGTLTQHLTYGLREAGFEVVCMEARQVAAALSAMRNKTDKHDARGIAQILRSGWYSRVHVKSVESHHLRALLTSRKVIQRKCIDLENEIRGLLKVFGVKLPMRLSRGAFDVAVRDTIESDPGLSRALLPMLHARQMLFATFMELDRRVRKAAHEDEVCTRFMGIPGVAEITALSFKAAVDDPARFKSSRTVGAHFGLTPRRFQSGEKDNPGRISHAGDSDVRAALYAAANAMLMRSIKWSSLKAWGMRLMKTKGRRRAIVAVARKLAVVLHRMWADGSEFRHGSEVAA
ncbi:MAG: IS110 family transposase [Brevundimonas sp.]|uniref:IS110 family transposase n=1 Tax=Brevundimonas sp. TaxID=1871086 RepID=UPI000DB3515B|nr:IS110 family transposase [Brevundimonas sp.]PZU71434.1 MAG: IS110 family transposase [Brevundimonas sp.]